MKNKIIKIVLIVFSAIILLLSNTACFTKPTFKRVSHEQGVWACEEIVLTQYDNLKLLNPGRLYLDGKEIDFYSDEEIYSKTLVFYDKNRYDAFDFEDLDRRNICIWEVNYKWRLHNLTLTVSKDYAYERGESEVDYTGKKFDLEKQSDPDSFGIEKFRLLRDVEGTWSCDDLTISTLKDNRYVYFEGQKYNFSNSITSFTIILYDLNDDNNKDSRNCITFKYAWQGEDLMVCVNMDTRYDSGLSSVSYQGTKFLLKKQQ